MPKHIALPRLFGTTVLLIALIALALPALALAAEEEGGPLELPVLVLSPVAFPKTTVQTESPAQAVDVANVGGGEAAMIESVNLEGPDSGAFKVTNNGCNKLFPGEHCTVWVSFLPTETGERQATLALGGSNVAATLPLAATGVPALLEFSPASHDFGIVRVNETNSVNLQISNSGEGIAQIGNLSIGGPDSGYFWTGNSTCWSHPLAPGESCFAEANFNPREPRAYEAEFQASANGSNFAAALTGTGGSAQLEPGANPVELGAVTVGSHGDVRTIVLTNNGNISGGYFIVVIAGGDSGSFQLLDENCSAEPVAPAATCIARVRFTPQSPGLKQARLALFGDSDGGTMVFLSGEGQAPAATFSPGFDFGTETAGNRGAAHVFTLRNDGSAPLELAGVSLTGAHPDQFVLSADECTDAVLAAGEECAVRVRFAPDSAGAKSARLRIGSAAGPFSAALAGTGVSPAGAGSAVERGGAAAASASAESPRRHRKARPFKRGANIVVARAMRRR